MMVKNHLDRDICLGLKLVLHRKKEWSIVYTFNSEMDGRLYSSFYKFLLENKDEKIFACPLSSGVNDLIENTYMRRYIV